MSKFSISKIKNLNYNEKNNLSLQIRKFLIDHISVTGGHLSSNLGVVELTIALHSVLNSPEDKIIFDVGHQSYTHKLLTGREHLFPTLRKENGLSGFIAKKESSHDIWESGHSSTSISAAIAYALANPNNHVVVVIGDSSIVNGVSLEAINHLGELNLDNITIILNDNDMSISDSVGGFKKSLSESKIKEDTISELSHFNIDYVGPYDGHNIKLIENVLKSNMLTNSSKIIHFKTIKGKGFKQAEDDNHGIWHGVGQFNPKESKVKTKEISKTWPEVISSQLELLMEKDDKITVTTPAMELGSSLTNIHRKYPNRFFDVGISEEHAVVFNSALSETGKFKPFLSIYSTFLQRGYDFLLTDLVRKNNHVVLGIDRCGFVGPDGSTHHGLWDVSFLSTLPNTTIFHPLNSTESLAMLKYAFSQKNGLYAIRYSKNEIDDNLIIQDKVVEIKWNILRPINKVNVISYGRILQNIIDNNNDKIGIINANIINILDKKIVNNLNNSTVIIAEEIIKNNSLYENLIKFVYENNLDINIVRIGVDDPFLEHSTFQEQLEKSLLDYKSINEVIYKYL